MLSNQIRAAMVAASVHAPCEAAVTVDGADCGRDLIQLNACVIAASMHGTGGLKDRGSDPMWPVNASIFDKTSDSGVLALQDSLDVSRKEINEGHSQHGRKVMQGEGQHHT